MKKLKVLLLSVLLTFLNITISYSQGNTKIDTEYEKGLSTIFPMRGHAVGFYMAKLIEQELGLEILINNFNNPIAFINAYNRAAIKNQQNYVFSNGFIGYIKSISQFE